MFPKNDPEAVLSDPRYEAVRRRDHGQDGLFYYAVRTTGVFCKPSCKARLARPENIWFFAKGDAAQAAGYRPCLRCRPLLGTPGDPVADLMRAMAAYIEKHSDEHLPLDRLAAQAQMSLFHFQRTFKAVVGISPRELQAGHRMTKFKHELRQGAQVVDAAFDAGFGSASRIYERVDGGLGMTPSAYRAGGRGETISYACRDSVLGPLMMAATDRGICFVQFGPSETELLAILRSEFPNATLTPAVPDADGDLELWIEALNSHLSSGAPHPDLPLDLRGTAFQLKVWRFLLTVKPGDVVSYAEVAKGIGAPGAVRAAASACAANRIGILIPCHRVLRSDGTLGGYRWGTERKRALLESERRRPPSKAA